MSAKEKSDLKIIQQHLAKIWPQLAEGKIYDSLACFFYNYKGIFVHSLKLDQHLKTLTEKAKLYRRQNKSISFKLTPIEKKLAEQFNIQDQDLNDTADIVLNEIKWKRKLINDNSINGRFICQTVDEALKGNETNFIKKLFKPGQYYDHDQIKSGVKLGKFYSECHFAGENDLLIMLPDLRLFLCIEIKHHMKKQEENDDNGI